ncbi:unnamed protein product [Rhizoctonia solani]|uniref:Cyanovirin-N domain-containing protein n=1 Tax=Rhizoctonia solani TaxID=456999 RepID=A0A8H3CH43_9AGAM|nr:unnamed protein product [Rhizoctonia solani]
MAFLATAQKFSIGLSDCHTLSARLLNTRGEWEADYFDLDDCIGNIDGKLTWDGRGYSNTATNIWLSILDSPPVAYLYATLKKNDTSYVEAGIDLNEGIANVGGEFKFKPVSEVHPPPPRRPTPADCTPPSTQADTLSPEQAQGTITTLPPHTPLCTAFAAIFTEPSGRQLRFTACPIIAFPTFSAKVTLHYGEMSEASGMRSFGGSASKTKVSLYLDNGVRIVGEVVQGGPDKEVTVAGSGHWGISR